MIHNELSIASDIEVALWICPVCEHSGTLNIKGMSVYQVIEALSDHHEALSKNLCKSERLPKLIRPQCWFQAVDSLMRDQSWKPYVQALQKIARLSQETGSAHLAANTAIDIAREVLRDPHGEERRS